MGWIERPSEIERAAELEPQRGRNNPDVASPLNVTTTGLRWVVIM
jgi:hypothetical protein